MNTFELAKSYIASQRYTILEEDSNQGHIAFRYQLNTIHFWAKDDDDDNYFLIALPNFIDITDDIDKVKEICYNISKNAKMVKLYNIGNIVLIAAELFYLNEEDLKFQIKNALKYLVLANDKYEELAE
jgi:hypothetical protein